MGLRRKLQGGPLCRIGFRAGMVVRELQSPGCWECWDLKIYALEKHHLRKQSFERSERYKIHNTFRNIAQESSKKSSQFPWLRAVFVNVMLAFSMSASFLIEVLHLQPYAISRSPAEKQAMAGRGPALGSFVDQGEKCSNRNNMK